MKFKKIGIILLAAVLCTATAAVGGTKAYFTNKAQSQNNTFNAGTLILGGYDKNVEDSIKTETANKFMSLNIQNIKPGLPKEVGKTTLRNIGSLPFKLFRITASNINQSCPLLDEVIEVEIYIDNQKAYTGRLSNLRATNGGYFDPIFPIPAKTDHEMTVYVTMDENAGNAYQGATLTCDLTAYATQTNTTFAGDQNSIHYNLASVQGSGTVNDPKFSVTAWNDADPNGYVNFQYTWQPNDVQNCIYDKNINKLLQLLGISLTKDFELYNIEIKHEKGIPDADIGGINKYDPSLAINWRKIKVKVNWNSFTRNWVISSDDSDLQLNNNDVTFDYTNNIIKIKKSVFPTSSSDSIDPTGWKGFEVRFNGIQIPERPAKVTDWKYWSLNRD